MPQEEPGVQHAEHVQQVRARMEPCAERAPAHGIVPPMRFLGRVRGRLRQRLSASPVAGNVLRLLAGNAFAQVLTLAAYPILTRIYAPAQIGLLSTLMAAVTILAPASALRLEMALPLARTNREAGSMLAASAGALMLTSLAITCVLLLMPAAWPADMAVAYQYRWALPVALLAFGGYVIMVGEATRQARFGDIARTRVAQAFSGPVCQIGLGLGGLGTPGLIAGYVIGQSAGTFGLVRKLLRGPASPLRRISRASVCAGISRHRNFVLFSSWTGVVNAAASYSMTVAFAFLYGPAISAYMFLGERILMRPLFLITSSILPVYTKEVVRTRQTDPARLSSLFQRVAGRQALLSVAWIGPIVVAAPYLIPAVFGAQWGESAKYVQILAIGYFPTSVLHPVMHTLQMLKEQRLSAALDVGRGLAVFASIAAVAAMRLPPLTAAIACSVVQALAMVAIFLLTWRRVRQVSRDGG
ncbi:lipopolysaccharide biosynthesis protein [Pseudorhodoferax sp.]|uniref:lipopolysaccharide biosynthesis protein n=1 Tax=Pseudorhodoferax sp. TaxID=1993553 RepID=UPI0039E34C33